MEKPSTEVKRRNMMNETLTENTEASLQESIVRGQEIAQILEYKPITLNQLRRTFTYWYAISEKDQIFFLSKMTGMHDGTVRNKLEFMRQIGILTKDKDNYFSLTETIKEDIINAGLTKLQTNLD